MRNQETKTINQKQPNSRHCFVCGLENPIGLKLKIYKTEPGVIETTYTAPDHFQGYPGVLHGGIVAALLDEISGRALMGDPSEPRFMFTGKIEVKYRKNVPVGQPLKITGKAGKARSKMAEAWAGIYDEKGTLLAEANNLLIDVPEGTLDMTALEALGWKVYPDQHTAHLFTLNSLWTKPIIRSSQVQALRDEFLLPEIDSIEPPG